MEGDKGVGGRGEGGGHVGSGACSFFLRTSGGGKGRLVSLVSVVSAEFLEGLG